MVANSSSLVEQEVVKGIFHAFYIHASQFDALYAQHIPELAY
jgi:preprotein translocase subunit SecB